MYLFRLQRETAVFPGGASGKEPAGQHRRRKKHGFAPWVRKTPGGGRGNPLQYSRLENPRGQRSPGGLHPQGHKEADTTEATSHNEKLTPRLFWPICDGRELKFLQSPEKRPCHV